MRKLFKPVLIISLLVLVLSACSPSGKSITIGAATYTEHKVLAYMYQALIEDATDINVKVKPDLGMDPKIIEAMDKGEVDMSTQYTGTALSSFFTIKHPKDSKATLKQAKKDFGEKYNFKWYDPLGFQNTYAFAVRKETAQEHNLKKISDFKNIADEIKAGVDTNWKEKKNDGYNAFMKEYGFEFGKVASMEPSLVYEAIKNKNVDTALVYTTDARIQDFDLTLLEDDLHFFPPYEASPVIRQETLDKYPDIEKAIQPLIGKIDEETMGQLNGEVDIDKQDPKDVAVNYLKKQGLLDK